MADRLPARVPHTPPPPGRASGARAPKDYSPFTPGQPVPPEFFVGRQTEIQSLLDRIAAAAQGRLQTVFLTGERGIGKSSLAAFAHVVAERNHQMLGLHTFMGGVDTLEEMARRVFDRLLKESAGQGWWERVREFFGNRVREVGLFGVSLEFGASPEELRRLVQDFAPALRNLKHRLGEGHRGILLILDDINGLAELPAFANWLKSLVDEIATAAAPLPLCLALVGLEDRRRSLIELQPSLARVFDLIEIRPWSDDETRDFYRKTFEKVGIRVEREAEATLARFAGGLPVLAHEIGDAVFKADADGVIGFDDAQRGLMVAADVVGRKHLQPEVFRALRSTRYRSILRKLARRQLTPDFRRGELIRELSEDERKVLDNFLRKSKSLGVLESDDEAGPGAYRFRNELHRLYLMLEAARAQRGPAA